MGGFSLTTPGREEVTFDKSKGQDCLGVTVRTTMAGEAISDLLGGRTPDLMDLGAPASASGTLGNGVVGLSYSVSIDTKTGQVRDASWKYLLAASLQRYLQQ